MTKPDFTDKQRNEHYRALLDDAMKADDANRVREICHEWGIDNADSFADAFADHLRWRKFWQAEEKREQLAEALYLLDSLCRHADHRKQTLRRCWWN